MVIEALFTITKYWKQPKGSLTGKWMNRQWYLHTMDCYSRRRTSKWKNLKRMMPSKRSQIEKVTHHIILLQWHSWKKKATGTENRSVVSRDWDGGRTDYKGSAQGNFLRNGILCILIVLIVKQLYAFVTTLNYLARRVNFTLYKIFKIKIQTDFKIQVILYHIKVSNTRTKMKIQLAELEGKRRR